MIGSSASGSRSERVRRCGACREQLHEPQRDVLDCPRCGGLVHLSCAWDAPTCTRCGESLSIEVMRHARRQADTRWQRLLAFLRDLRAQPLGVLAQLHSDRGRWMGISVSLFFFGVALGIALTLLLLLVARRT